MNLTQIGRSGSSAFEPCGTVKGDNPPLSSLNKRIKSLDSLASHTTRENITPASYDMATIDESSEISSKQEQVFSDALSDISSITFRTKDESIHVRETYIRFLEAVLKKDKTAQKNLHHSTFLFETLSPSFERFSTQKLYNHTIDKMAEEGIISKDVFYTLLRSLHHSPKAVDLTEEELIGLYTTLFSLDAAKALGRSEVFLLIKNTPKNFLPYVLTSVVALPSIQSQSLSALISLLRRFDTESELLIEAFIENIFAHPSVIALSRPVLERHLKMIPSKYKGPLMTGLMSHRSFQKASLDEVISLHKEFITHPKQETTSQKFAKAMIHHPAVRGITNFVHLAKVFPQEPTETFIPFIVETLKHNVSNELDIEQLLIYNDLFTVCYHHFPCSDKLADEYYENLMSVLGTKSLDYDHLHTLISLCPTSLTSVAAKSAMKVPAYKNLPLTLLEVIFNVFTAESHMGRSREFDQSFMERFLEQNQIKALSFRDLYIQYIASLGGYRKTDCIVKVIEHFEGQLSLDEIDSLARVYLSELKSVEGEKTYNSMPFYSAVCERLQRKNHMSLKEARAETHKLVHSVEPKS